MLSPPAPPIPPAPPVERLARIIGGLCDAIAARGVGGLLTAPLLFLLWSWLRRTATRVTRIAGRIGAGAPSAAARRRGAVFRPPRPPAPRLPRGHAWLVRLVPGTAGYGAQLQTLLADPLMAPLIAAPSMRRRLNPLCRMLGVPVPPPAVSSPRPAAAPAAAETKRRERKPVVAGLDPAIHAVQPARGPAGETWRGVRPGHDGFDTS